MENPEVFKLNLNIPRHSPFTQRREPGLWPWDELEAELGPACIPFTPSKFYPKIIFLESTGFEVMGEFLSIKTQAQQQGGYCCQKKLKTEEGP